MPSRRKSPTSKTPSRAPASLRSGTKRISGRKRRSEASMEATTRRWRRDVRPRLVSAAVSATGALRWSPTLIEVLLEELYVDEAVQELLGKAPDELRGARLPAGGRGCTHPASQLAGRRSRFHPRTTRHPGISVPVGLPPTSQLHPRRADPRRCRDAGDTAAPNQRVNAASDLIVIRKLAYTARACHAP